MNFKNLLKLIIFSTSALTATNETEFIKSFIDHYDFKVESRYTHEYHQHLLQKTSQSFCALENKLLSKNFNNCGRIIIAGYEGEAFPSYYTDYKKAKINDEASSQNKFGWSLRLHNKFGFMTGFLFKEINEINKKSFRDSSPCDQPSSYEHINPESIELFNDDSGIFLEHSFEKCYNLTLDYKELLEKNLKNSPYKILKILKSFWNELYLSESQASENQVAATQDILFSIEYANYLLNSNSPILKYYTGPDITYPIETSLLQDKESTKNSQDFIPAFITNLKAVNDEATVYIFDSFVDGVGKSTMLGNVKNWIEFGPSVEKYKRVDNSSSQFAEVFKFNDKIYIADLPAQVSHFTYKPDGFVYVNAESELDSSALEKVVNYAKENKAKLLKEFFKKIEMVGKIIQESGPLDKYFENSNDPQDLFIRNLFILKKIDTNSWIPFCLQGEPLQENNFIVNALNINQVRILKPLNKASSYGLKNIDQEQMLFTKVNFPAAYENFLNDLISKLKTNKIKNVIFVDFLSMYPRSSRENIRVNYLLFQLSLLDSSFDVENSFYKNFISGAQLFANITSPQTSPFMLNHFRLEVALRLILFKLIDEDNSNFFKEIGITDLSAELKSKITEITQNKNLVNFIEESSNDKLYQEQEKLKKIYGKNKEYLSIWQFSFELVHAFSNKIKQLFTEEITCPKLNQLWADLDEKVENQNQFYNGEINKKLKLTTGQDVTALYEFAPQFRSEPYLTPFLQTLRAAWYMSFANLLNCKVNGGGQLEMENIKYKITPYLLKIGENGDFYLIQKALIPWTGGKNTDQTKNINSKQAYGEFLEQPYLIKFPAPQTSKGLYAFDHDAGTKNQRATRISSISKIIKSFQEENGIQSAISTSELYEALHQNSEWKAEQAFLKQQSQKKQNNSNEKALCLMGKAEQVEGARLFVRAIATLEMILKDPASDIVVRKGNKKDFIAAIKLLEQVTLPKYFKLLFPAPLFDDYKNISPLISWEYFE